MNLYEHRLPRPPLFLGNSWILAMTEKKEQAPKVSVVVTAKNDDPGIRQLRKDLAKQTRKPDEIIIIRAEDYHNCSRAEGRNIGIRKAKYNNIAVTDVGCRPHKDWLERLVWEVEESRKKYKKVEKGKRQNIDGWVVAGWYRAIARSPFQQAIVPYLVSDFDRQDAHYLPASRSIAFTKETWEKVGGYPEDARSAGEDLAFARRMATDPSISIAYAPDALVDWEPPKTLEQYFLSICDHTSGNFEARITPHIIRNMTVAVRWILLLLIPQLLPIYFLWPIVKHRHLFASKGQTFQGLTLKRWHFLVRFPVVQLVTDCGIILGMLQFSLSSMRLPLRQLADRNDR